MTPFTIDEMQVAIKQLSPAATLELERNLYRNRLEADDGVRDESGVEGETTEG